MPLDLALDGVGGADGAGVLRRPPAGVLNGPLGQIEVEGTDRCQARWQSACLITVLVPSAMVTVFGLVRIPPLPRVGDLGGQLQAVDAGVVGLQVGPEQLAEPVGELLQRGEIQGGLAFFEVVDQQVADRPAGQAVPVDHLFGGGLPAAGEFPQPRGAAAPKIPSWRSSR